MDYKTMPVHGILYVNCYQMNILCLLLIFQVMGKWWGKKTIQPIIAVHGQQDNAGSWDPLCELLPAEYSVLAIDLPGHGYSSYLPPFQNYYHTDFVAILRRIKKHLDMDKMHLLAHSEGSAICFSYATVFPDDVESYFGIDYLTNCYENETDKADSLCSIIDEKIKYGLRNNELSKTRTWDESKRTWIIAFPWSLNEKSAEILMKRGVARMPDGKYRFSRDQRMKAYEACVFTPEQVIKLAGKIKCHVRLIKATNSTLFDVGLTYCPGIFDIIQQKAKSFKLFEIEGGHHVHMDLPEKILPWFLELHERPITTV
ncbi:probable serine hydrolase isoform X2 [Halyomorpha halys]|uniref:probable serine hydrolase isoform X2 n=1 Tax=Halyomorpha halys TaxID=286706 RepID=UPI0006D50B6A|nr:probable serine hydrolase isoform X2 [Halyomorpha halys]